jgi:acyl-coenzyme A thioesterase PaaI-like protein
VPTEYEAEYEAEDENEAARTHAPTIDEQSNHCFACGPHNPQGLHLNFHIDPSDPHHPQASAVVHLPRAYEGAPGYLHGGIIATLLDEAMSKLNRPLQLLAMTRHMEVDYLRPAPIDTPLSLTARHLRREGRKLFHTAELILPDGTPLARAKALFVVLDPAPLQARAGAARNPA